MKITPELIAKVMPDAEAENVVLYAPHLAAACEEFGILTPLRVAAFLATIAEETGELDAVSENLNYSDAGLARTWPNRYAERDELGEYLRPYRPNALARSLHRQPERIANHCYANRMGNGDEASGDGWRYRGAGGIQETGKSNHFAVAMRFDIDPEKVGDWLRTPEGAMRSAAWGFTRRGAHKYADRNDFDGVRDVVNLGLKTHRLGDANGYTSALKFFNSAKKALA